MAQDVFVSYSVKDKAVADAIVARLEAESIRCWVAPRDVVPGADWGESIINAIESSRIMILVFTSNANASPQIKREVERAVDKSVYIIPFRVDNIEPTRALEYFISTSQWMDAFAPPLEPHLEDLANTVKAILKGQPPPVPRPVRPPPPTEPPLRARTASSGRWIAIVVGLAIVACAGWYFANRGVDRPPVSQETPSPTPAVIASQSSPRPATSETPDTSAAQEQETREKALKAQLAEAQEKMARLQEAARESARETPPPPSRPWIFPDSSSRYLSREELSRLSPEQLWRARNEIYARNGYRFSSPRGVAFAQSLGSNYRGVDPDDDRVFGRMNPYEQANVSLIRSMEQR
jgi:hypothetical protein